MEVNTGRRSFLFKIVAPTAALATFRAGSIFGENEAHNRLLNSESKIAEGIKAELKDKTYNNLARSISDLGTRMHQKDKKVLNAHDLKSDPISNAYIDAIIEISKELKINYEGYFDVVNKSIKKEQLYKMLEEVVVPHLEMPKLPDNNRPLDLNPIQKFYGNTATV